MNNRWWVSWWHTESMGVLELHSPWWVSGERGDGAKSICAAVITDGPSEQAVRELVRGAYDTPPTDIDFRFIESNPPDWPGPFSTRFERADWMQWPARTEES